MDWPFAVWLTLSVGSANFNTFYDKLRVQPCQTAGKVAAC
jgi:hypothetical protein